ncbi:MAG: TRAP transporter small permease [Enhydrobacter sp.]|nr:MAG: TRAP transporter small permease [Enhydrobacter sp.]
MVTIYKTWRFFQDRVVGYAAALILLGMTILSVVEIFRRYVQGQTFHWGQDAVTYFMVTATFIYFGTCQAQRTHLAVTILPEWLRRSGRVKLGLAVQAIASLLGILFVVAVIWWGHPAAERALKLERMTESMIIPLWPFMYALLVGLALMGVTLLFQFYRDVMRLVGRDPFPWEPNHLEMEL